MLKIWAGFRAFNNIYMQNVTKEYFLTVRMVNNLRGTPIQQALAQRLPEIQVSGFVNLNQV